MAHRTAENFLHPVPRCVEIDALWQILSLHSEILESQLELLYGFHSRGVPGEHQCFALVIADLAIARLPRLGHANILTRSRA